MPRDNTDQIPAAEIVNPKGPGYDLEWRAKDKLRAVDFPAGEIVIEQTPNWTIDAGGAFGNMFLVRRSGHDQVWTVAGNQTPLVRGGNVFPNGVDGDGRSLEVVKGGVDVAGGEEFGLFFAGEADTVRAAIRIYTAPENPPPPPPPPAPATRWGNGQFYMGPRIDKIHDEGVDHWLELGEEHGFDGAAISCDGLPLDRQGLRDLVGRSTFSWIWVWPDSNWIPTGSIGLPDGGLMGNEARAYYDDLARILLPVAGRIGLSVGSDPLEWTTPAEIGAWAEHMRALLGPELLVGARQDGGVGNPLPGTYAGWGHHFDDKATIAAQVATMVAAAGGRPCHAGEDRLREREPRRAKDFSQKQQLEAMPLFVKAGTAAIWGVLGAESDGRHESGTLPWDNPAAVREALSGSPTPPPPPTPEGNMGYLVDDHRNARIKIAELSTYGSHVPSPENNEFVWQEPGAQVAEIEIGNTDTWAVHTIWYFSGVDRGWADETTIVCELRSPTGGWHEVSVYVEEKEGALDQAQLGRRVASRHEAEKDKVLGEPVILPPGSRMRVTAWHNVKGNRPHVECKLRAKVHRP